MRGYEVGVWSDAGKNGLKKYQPQCLVQKHDSIEWKLLLSPSG